VRQKTLQMAVTDVIKEPFDISLHDPLRPLQRDDLCQSLQRLEEGVMSASDQGTPQGGLVSPALANIYLHYVLDLWFEKRYAKSSRPFCGGSQDPARAVV
jgi:hypothetical protein